MDVNETIIYEQPLSEPTRICLRLEHLYIQARANLTGLSVWHHRLVMSALIEIMRVVDRPDLRTKLTTALTQQSTRLSILESNPQVDNTKLRQVLDKLDTLIDSLYMNRAKMGQELKNNVFLDNIRQHLNSPGGACGFNTPAFHLWIQQPANERTETLKLWFSEFEQLEQIINLLLSLIRQNGQLETNTALEGFYHQNLDSNVQYEMIRVLLPKAHLVYPEISVGRHRLSVRFLELGLMSRERDQQTKQNVIFKLASCRQ